MKQLVVNADDFGLDEGVNAGVARAHEQGIVTSASLMVRQPGARRAAQLAARLPLLSVGLHIDLGEWSFDGDGWRTLYRRVDDRNAAAVEREVAAQLGLFEQLIGSPPTHIDSHQHVHREEPVRSILGRIARELSVPLRHHSRFRYFGGFYGQGRGGTPHPEAISSTALCEILRSLPEGATELCCHPAARFDPGWTYGSERLLELEALCSTVVREELVGAAVALTSFARRPLSAAGSA